LSLVTKLECHAAQEDHDLEQSEPDWRSWGP
jgi:hypothetical protein